MPPLQNYGYLQQMETNIYLEILSALFFIVSSVY